MSQIKEIMPDILGEPPKHSKQSLRLWLKLLTCSNFVEKRIRTFLKKKFDKTLPQFDVMAALDRSKTGLTMGDLSERLMVSNGNVTGVIARLEEEQLVERRIHQSDGRTFVATLTPEGRKQFRKMAKAHENLVDSLFLELSDADILDLMELLDATKASLKTFETKQQSK